MEIDTRLAAQWGMALELNNGKALNAQAEHLQQQRRSVQG